MRYSPLPVYFIFYLFFSPPLSVREYNVVAPSFLVSNSLLLLSFRNFRIRWHAHRHSPILSLSLSGIHFSTLSRLRLPSFFCAG
jgi:hypothetical protein